MSNYLHGIEHFRVIDCDWRIRVHGALCTRYIKNPILPMSRLSFPISKSVHAKPLPSTLMPSTLIAMTIGKRIDAETMHLVCKVFSRIRVTISTKGRRISLTRNAVEIDNIYCCKTKYENNFARKPNNCHRAEKAL